MKKKVVQIITILAITLIPGCELFETSPFPVYLGNIVSEHRFAAYVEDVFPNSPRTRYQLFPFTHNNSQHLYLLISPTLDTSDIAATRAVFFRLNERGEYQRAIRIPSDTRYSLRSNFGLPFVLANSGHSSDRIISGRVVIEPNAHEVVGPLEHELDGGYGLGVEGTNRDGTYLLSGTGSSSIGYFTLDIIAYDDAGSWNPLPPAEPRTINIIPPDNHRDTSGPDPVGYIFTGLILDPSSRSPTDRPVTLLIESLTTRSLHLLKPSVETLISYQQNEISTPLLSDPNNRDRAIPLEDSDFYTYTDQEIIVHRRTGILERYDLNATFQDSSRTERRSGILYAFSNDGSYMYRFDPETLILQVINTWW